MNHEPSTSPRTATTIGVGIRGSSRKSLAPPSSSTGLEGARAAATSMVIPPAVSRSTDVLSTRRGRPVLSSVRSGGIENPCRGGGASTDSCGRDEFRRPGGLLIATEAIRRESPMGGATTDVTVAAIDEMEALHGGLARRARATLGVSAWGMQVLTLPPGWDGYPEHNHDETAYDPNQEEVYIPLAGSATLVAGTH